MTYRLLIITIATVFIAACGSSGPSSDSGDASGDSGIAPTPAPPAPPVNIAPMAMDDKIVLATAAPIDVFVLQNDSDADGDPLAIVALGTPTAGQIDLMHNDTPMDAADDFVRFTAPTGFSGSAIFGYTISDDANATSHAVVTVQSDSAVDAQANAAPLARDDLAETTPATAAVIDVLANDVDADGDTLYLLSVMSAAHGAVAIDANGTADDSSDDRLVYTPAPGFSGSDSFRYQISDGRYIVSAAVSVSVQAVTVLPPEQVCGVVMIGPVIAAQIALHQMDGAGRAVGAPVAQATTDANGQWCLTLPAARDDLLVVSQGGSYFDPADSGNASDGLRSIDVAGGALESVLFSASDFAMLTPFTGALVSKSRRESAGDDFAAVLSANRAAAASAFGFDLFAVNARNPLNPAGAPVPEQHYAMATGGAASAINRLAIGLALPAPDYGVVNAFIRDYSDCRLDGLEGDALVELTLDGVRTPLPSNLDMNLEILRFRNNLYDVYAGVSLTQIDEALCGQSGEQPDSIAPVFTYLPDDVLLVATDMTGLALAEPTVQNFLTSAQAVDNRDIDPMIAVTLENGSALPATLAIGTTNVVFVASDLAGNSTTSPARAITVTNIAPPLANDDSATGDEDSAIAIDILGNDTSSSSVIDPASVAILSQTTGGVLAIDPASGMATLTPAANYFGTFTFSYTVADVTGQVSNVALVTVTIAALAEDPPVAADDAATVTAGSPLRVNVLGNDDDPDPAGLSGARVQLVDLPQNGSAIVDPGDNAVIYTPAPGFIGVDSLTYVITDAQGLVSNLATLNLVIEATGVPPVAVSMGLATDEDTVLIAPLPASDADGSIDYATVTLLTTPLNGALVIDGTGQINYTPVANFFGSDSFTFTVADNAGIVSNAATVTISVNPTADDPQAIPDTASTDERLAVRIVVLANDSDVDGDLDSGSVEIVVPPTSGVAMVETNGDITYTPDNGFFGSDMLAYRVADGRGVFTAAVGVTIDVLFVDDAPLAMDDAAVTPQDTVIVLDLLANDSDPDTSIDPASVSLLTSPLGNAVLAPATGIVTYTPPPGYTGEDSFTYRVDDVGGNTSTTATVTVAVWPGDDPDFDGVANGIEIAVGTDPDLADDVYVFVNPLADPLVSDGDSWQTAFTDLASADAAGRLDDNVGATTYVLMADNSGAVIAGSDWSLDLNGRCDNMVFVGGLDYLVTTPQVDSDGLPATRIEAVDPVTRPVYLQDCSNIQFHSVSIRGGNGVTDGAGVLLRSAVARMVNVHISNNQALVQGGAVALFDGGGALTTEISLQDSLIEENGVTTAAGGIGRGGAIFAEAGTVVNLESSRLIGNRLDQLVGAPVFGGGAALYAEDADVRITASTLAGNISNTVGGALTISGNGGIVSVEHSTISGNESALRGGGVYLLDTGANVTVHNNLLVSNFSDEGGGAYAEDALDSRFSNNTVFFNRASSDGGGFIVTVSSPVFNDNIVQFNSAVVSGNNIGGNIGLLASLNAANNFLDNSFAGLVGFNNTDLDPTLDVGYYLAHPTSPAIDYSLSFQSGDAAIALDTRYTDASGTTTDSGALDSGYHYETPAIGAPDLIALDIVEFGLNGVNQRIRILPTRAGVPIGPGHRIYVDAGSGSMAPHLYEQTSYVRDPRGSGTSTEARDLGNGYYEILADTDASGTYILDTWVDGFSGPPLFRFIITVN